MHNFAWEELNQGIVQNLQLITNLFDKVELDLLFGAYSHMTKPCFWVFNSIYVKCFGCLLPVYLNKAMKVADEGGLQSLLTESNFSYWTAIWGKKGKEKKQL